MALSLIVFEPVLPLRRNPLGLVVTAAGALVATADVTGAAIRRAAGFGATVGEALVYGYNNVNAGTPAPNHRTMWVTSELRQVSVLT